jgi:hypothetical protein
MEDIDIINTLNLKTIENIFEINYLSNIIKACEKNNINKDLLEKKLGELKEDQTTENKQSIKNITESPQQQYNDDYLYQKPWTKLTPIHKIIKIKEFINLLLIDNEQDKQELKTKLIELIKTKVLTKKDTVTYDSVKGRIISIRMLQHKNGKYFI